MSRLIARAPSLPVRDPVAATPARPVLRAVSTPRQLALFGAPPVTLRRAQRPAGG